MPKKNHKLVSKIAQVLEVLKTSEAEIAHHWKESEYDPDYRSRVVDVAVKLAQSKKEVYDLLHDYLRFKN